jgi:hypothetical protein
MTGPVVMSSWPEERRERSDRHDYGMLSKGVDRCEKLHPGLTAAGEIPSLFGIPYIVSC